MNRLEYPFNHEWHVAINQHHDQLRASGEWNSWMYEAKDLADEVPRMALLFAMERKGELRKTHQQCSQQAPVPVPDNHLKCCLGVKCAACPHLLALDKIERSTLEQIDLAKAWTCAAHIMSKGGDKAKEGYILTVDDQMYWRNVYASMAEDDDIGGGQ